MKRLAAWVLTRVVRRLLGLGGRQQRSQPARRPASVRLLGECQLETRELPGDMLSGLFAASLGIGPAHDPVARVAGLIDDPAVGGLVSSPAGTISAGSAVRQHLPVVTADLDSTGPQLPRTHRRDNAAPSGPTDQVEAAPASASTRSNPPEGSGDALSDDFADRLLHFWDNFAASQPPRAVSGLSTPPGNHDSPAAGPSAATPAGAAPALPAPSGNPNPAALPSAPLIDADLASLVVGEGASAPPAPRAHGLIRPVRFAAPASGDTQAPAQGDAGKDQSTAAASPSDPAGALAPIDPNVVATEGTSFGGVIGSFTDADGNTNPQVYTVTVNWGDGQTSPGAIASGGSGGSGGNTFQISSGHTYAEEGSYNIAATVSDSADGAVTVVPATAYVTDAPLSAPSGGGTVAATQGVAVTAPLLSFSDADPNGSAGDYSALINWGDGSAATSGTVSGNGPFSVRGSHVYQQPGTYTVPVTVTDSGGSRLTVNATVNVSAAALPLHAASPTLVEGSSGSPVLVTFTDPDNNTNPALYNATITWGDGSPNSSGSVTAASGGGFQVSGSHTYAEEGSFPASVTVTDTADNASATTQATVTVSDAALTASPVAVNAVQGQPLVAPVATFTDADPSGTASDSSAVIDWGDSTTPTAGDIGVSGNAFQVQGGHTYATAGTYTITTTITDTGGASTTVTTTATVAAPSQAVNLTLPTFTQEQTYNGVLGTFTPPPGDPPPGGYQAYIAPGDGSLEMGTLTPDGNGSYNITAPITYGQPTTQDNGLAIPDPFVVTVVNPQNPFVNPAIGTQPATVNPAPLTPVPLNPGGWPNVPIGQFPLGQFTDPNPQAKPSDFHGTINWGDGTSPTPGTVQGSGGSFGVFGQHTYTAPGTYPVQITVQGPSGPPITINSTMTVTTPTASLQAAEGVSFSGTVATFSGNPAQATSATITWGDGNNSAGTITATGGNTFTVSGSHTYSDENTYPLSISVQMSSGGPLTASGPALVNDAALTPQGQSLSGTAGQLLAAAALTVATFTDANPQTSAADFSATIAWGDGTTSASIVQANGSGGFNVLGDHVYANAGTYTVTTTIKDDGGSSATATGTASIGLPEGQVYNVAMQVAAPAPGGGQASLATVYTATLNWGDGTTTSATVSPVTGGSGALQLILVGAHPYTEEGTYTITATVSDPSNNRSSVSSSVLVVDAPLAGFGINLNGVSGVSTGQVAVAGFGDANPYAATKDDSSGDYTARINWGDGSASTSGTVQANSDGSFTVLGSHNYANPGSYTVSTSITDAGGQFTTANGTATVASPWSVVGTPGQRSNDPNRAEFLSEGEATVDLNQGALRLSQALDFDQSPGTTVGVAPALVYNSATVSARPVIQLAVQSDPNGMVPTQAQVQLTWNGVAQSPVNVSTSGLQAGGIWNLAVQKANPVTTTGVYNWSATVTFTFADNSTRQVTASGTATVVARDSSVYGAGWSLDGIPQLVVLGTGVLWVTGAGDSRFFASNGSGGYNSPAEDFGTLVQNGDGTFTYTAKDQSKWNFNAQGQLTSVVDTHGLARVYGYDGQGRLSQVTAMDGGSTTFSYDPSSGLLNSITEPGGRVVQLRYDSSGNLTQITDVDNTTRTFGYDTAHHLTSDQWAPLNAAFTYDSASGLLTTVNLGLGTTCTLSSAAAQGLTGIVSGTPAASVTDGLSHTTRYTLDQRGRLLQQVLPDGSSTTTYQRDAAGQVTVIVDPLHHPTQYTYAYGAYNASVGGGAGDLVQVTYADGSWVQYQYDATFHHLTQSSNPLGVTHSSTYDPTTGDLLTSTDALGDPSTNTWSAGLLVKSTDPRHATTTNVYGSDRRLLIAFDDTGTPTFYRYDNNGNLSATEDANGHVTQTLYSPRNLLLATTDANGGVSSQTYNASGQVTSQTDARGFTTSTSYDQRGWVSGSSDALGNPTTDQYDAAGRLLQVTDARGDATAYQYDADGRQTATTDALGERSTTAYDADGDVVSSTDALGRSSTTLYDLLNRPLSSTDPLGQVSYTFYDVAGRAVRSVDADGWATLTSYDLDNRPVFVQAPGGATTQTTYDGDGDVSETLDALGDADYAYYDAGDRQVGTADADHLTSSDGYDLLGDVAQSTDQRGKKTAYSYDNLDRQIAATDPDGNTTQTVYDAGGNVIESIDANGKVTRTTYDGDGRPVSVQDPDGYVTRRVYDPVGDVVQSIDANGQATQTWYDALNRPVRVLDPNGHLTQTAYNAVGDVVAAVDGDGHVTQNSYNADDEQIGVRNPDGSITQQQFDGDGRLLSVTDPDSNATRYLYDGRGNQVVAIDPLGHATVSVYDQADRLTSVTDRDGRQITYAYDKDGRLLTETWYNADGTVADTKQYTYDQDGNLLTASNGQGTYQYTYDSAGRMLTQTDPWGLTLTYGYDPAGNVTSVQDSLGGQVTSVYDSDGRLTSRQFSGTGNTQLRLDQTYTPDGEVATQTRYSDAAGTQKVGSSAYTYDNAGQLTHLQHQNGSNGVLADYGYSYDGAGQLTSETDNGTTTPYGYDSAGQLTSAGSSSFSFDANGNRTMSGYQTGTNNQLSTDGTWNYSYDNEGNLSQKTSISTHESWTYTYDNANHLTGAVHKDGSGNLLYQATFKYDVLGNCVEEDDTPAGGQTTVTRYAYDGSGNVWGDLNGSNQLQMRRFYLDGSNTPFARLDASGNVAWYLADHLGSVRDIVNNSGVVLDHLDYDAWGNVTNETSLSNGDRYKYAGGQWQSSLGLYHFGQRWYEPKTARWTSQDPLSFSCRGQQPLPLHGEPAY